MMFIQACLGYGVVLPEGATPDDAEQMLGDDDHDCSFLIAGDDRRIAVCISDSVRVHDNNSREAYEEIRPLLSRPAWDETLRRVTGIKDQPRWLLGILVY